MNVDSEFEDSEEEHFTEDEDEEDDDDDDDVEILLGHHRQPPAPNNNQVRLPLHHFLRIIAGAGRIPAGADHPNGAVATTNDDLVDSLKHAGVLHTDRCIQAMRAVPRDLFLERIADGAYREEALVDTPIRIEELDFNISAPHMHGTCLEALSLSPGQSVLDVGAGCGLLTAAMAHIVGPRGFVAGIDIRKQCLAICKDNMRRLHAFNPSFEAQSAPVHFELVNVFIISQHHIGKYDRVHVGASCPPNKLAPLLRLLRPEGGVIVVPVSPSDLRVIKKTADGKISQRVISQVRFSDLEVPTDAEILLATLKAERKAKTAPVTIPSTYEEDIQDLNITIPVVTTDSAVEDGITIPGSLLTKRKGTVQTASTSSPSSSSPSPRSPSGVVGGFPSSLGSHHGGDAPGGSNSLESWPARLGKLLTSCSPSSSAKGKQECDDDVSDPGGSKGDLSPKGGNSSPPSSSSSKSNITITKYTVDPSLLGTPDMMLVGPGWHIPTHQSLLRRRCEHLRARHASGMRDALSSVVVVPDHFSQTTMHALIHYIYYDEVPATTLQNPEHVLPLLHAAQYYGTPRLTHICEMSLCQLLTAKKPKKSESAQQNGNNNNNKNNKKKDKDKEAQHSSDDVAMTMMMEIDMPSSDGADNDNNNAHPPHPGYYCKKEAAAALFGIADEQGLEQLRSVALDYVVHHYDKVSKTDAFKALSKEQVGMVAKEACSLLSEMTAAMKRMAHGEGEELPEPS